MKRKLRIKDDDLAPEDRKAFAVTQALFATDAPEFTALVDRLAELRGPQPGKRRQMWVKQLEHWTTNGTRDLAAAILYHIVRARLWAEPRGIDPLLLTVGQALGADLLGLDPQKDPDLRAKVGCQLLGVAVSAHIIAEVRDERGGVHIALTEPSFQKLKRLINGSASHVIHKVCHVPPKGVATKKKHTMLIARPGAPIRVVQAADKVQGTAWRINHGVLRHLDTTDHQIAIELDQELNEAQKAHRVAVIAEARELAILDRFYFPVTLDFRGRVNQRSGRLTYTGGGDYARGLLEFAGGGFVDNIGFGWLTWHTAQMWGNDLPYIPLGDGTAWVQSELTECEKRWQDAKHPVQFIAAAQAVKDAQQGRPVHLPVRVDASCSGLQHLAMLSGDAELAKLVNLWGDSAGDRQGMAWLETREDDFYETVAAQTGFSRKEVKAVVVPMLYGAGPKTSSKGIANTRKKKRRTGVTSRDAKTIREAVKLAAPRAFALLKWFNQVATWHNEINIPVRWFSPSGFEVIQDYRYPDRDRSDRQVSVVVNDQMRKLVKSFPGEQLNKKKQVVAITSSIVHSLDAALLAELVAGSPIDKWGVVHDAFAVPAWCVWDLLADNERAMHALYDADRLSEWAASWRTAISAGVSGLWPHAKREPLPSEMFGGLRALG